MRLLSPILSSIGVFGPFGGSHSLTVVVDVVEVVVVEPVDVDDSVDEVELI